MFMSGRYDFTIKQGSTFARGVSWKEGSTPVNLNGYTGRMQIRYKDYKGELAADMNDENGGVIVDLFNNRIQLYLSAKDTAKIQVRDCVYDLEMVKDDYVMR